MDLKSMFFQLVLMFLGQSSASETPPACTQDTVKLTAGSLQHTISCTNTIQGTFYVVGISFIVPKT